MRDASRRQLGLARDLEGTPVLIDALRLSVGTLSVLPVKPPATVDRTVARGAMLLAPIAVLPLALVAGAVVWVTATLEVSSLLGAALAIGVLAWGSRGMHLDGLSDTADGLGASFDRSRALQIMSRGDAGPMGVAALVIVLAAQAAALCQIIAATVSWDAAWSVVLLVCASRAVLAFACYRAIPSAKPEGLGSLVAGSVGRSGVAMSGGLVALLAACSAVLASRSWWLGLVAAALFVIVIAGWLWHCTRRLGGITGDVLGSCVEIALLVLLVVTAVPV